MKVTVEGGWPAWLADCTDADLRTATGSGTFSRGQAYAAARTVMRLHADGQKLVASVRGSGSRTYQTLVRQSSGRVRGDCSCPMTADCKHVVAVVLVARAQAAPSASAWETRLAPLSRPDDAHGTAPLALLLDVLPPKSGAPARLRLRPVTPGKGGTWVRTGVSWRELESTWSQVQPVPSHRAAVCALFAAFRAGQPSWYGGEARVHVDDLGPVGWPLLASTTRAGVALVSDVPGQTVVLQPPSAVVLDLGRVGDGPLEVSPVVRLDGDDVPLAGGLLVGSPAHGAVIPRADRLLLVPFLDALGPATHELAAGGVLTVPAAEVPRFLFGWYPVLRQRLTVTSLDGSVDLPEVRPPVLVVDVRFAAGHRTQIAWHVGYPVGDHLALADDPAGVVARDVAAERALLTALPDGLPGVHDDPTGRRLSRGTSLTGLETARFVREQLPVLLGLPDVVVRQDGTAASYDEVTEAPVIKVGTADSTEGDWFDLSVAVSVAGQDVPIANLLTALTLGEPQLLLPSGTFFSLDRPELDALRRIVEEARALQDRESSGLRLTPFHAGLWEELVSLGIVEHQSARWSQTVGGLLALDTLPRPASPVGLVATLRPYQLEGYHWLSLLWDHRLGGILADDMGLGKTVQTLAMAVRAYEQGTLGGTAGPLLVVAPTSVVGTWAHEASRFAPELSVVAITETAARSGRALAELVDGADLVVTSYALFRIDDDAYQSQSWCGLVLDEAQFVKNHQAVTYQCARRLPATFKLAITGTPLENSLMDLWSMLSITAPGLFPSPQKFTELFRKPIESGQSPEQLAVLRRRIRPLMLRRTKEQAAPDLPPKVEQVLSVPLNPAHRKVYDRHLARERQRILGLLDDLQRNRIAILSSLTTLRQLSLDVSLVDPSHAGKVRSSKIDVLLEQLHEVVDEGHRVLVFSQFTGFLALVRARLTAEGIGHCYLDGRTRNRPARIAEFTEGTAPVFLISLKAGGVGLTLTEADYVFVLDPWWNPAVEAQAVDRTHRIGQDKTVMVYRLVAADTIEEKVVALQQRKRDLFAQIVGDDAMTGSALTADDIRGLFS